MTDTWKCPHCGFKQKIPLRVQRLKERNQPGTRGIAFVQSLDINCVQCYGTVDLAAMVNGKYDFQVSDAHIPKDSAELAQGAGYLAAIVVGILALIVTKIFVGWVLALVIAATSGSLLGLVVWLLLRKREWPVRPEHLEWEAYQDPSLRFSLKYPAAWLPRKQMNLSVSPNAKLSIGDPRGQPMFEVFSLQSNPLEFYASQSPDWIKKEHPDVRVYASKRFPLVAAKDCLRLTVGYSEPSNGGKIETFTDFFFVDNGLDVLSLNFKVLAAEYTAMTRVFETVVNSLKLSDSAGGCALFWFNWKEISDSGHNLYGAYVYNSLLPYFSPATQTSGTSYDFFDGDFMPGRAVQIPHVIPDEARCLEEIDRQGWDVCYVVAAHSPDPVNFRDIDSKLRSTGIVGYIGMTSCLGIDLETFMQLPRSMSLVFAFKIIEGVRFERKSFEFLNDEQLRSMGFDPHTKGA